MPIQKKQWKQDLRDHKEPVLVIDEKYIFVDSISSETVIVSDEQELREIIDQHF